MANLTLSLDDKLLQAARLRATKEGTSVNEICRRAIENYAHADSTGRLQRFDALIARLESHKAKPLAPPWKNRGEMYEELLAPGSGH